MITDKQAKLLRLLGSDNDHEALAALKKLKKSVKSWTAFVDGLTKEQSGQSTQQSRNQEAPRYRWDNPPNPYAGYWRPGCSNDEFWQAKQDLEEAMRKQQQAWNERANTRSFEEILRELKAKWC